MSDRPAINVKLSHTDKPLAVFTHTCLRPILKQKHNTLCAIIRDDKNFDVECARVTTDTLMSSNDIVSNKSTKTYIF